MTSKGALTCASLSKSTKMSRRLSRLEGRGAVSLAFDGVSPRAHARIFRSQPCSAASLYPLT